MSLDNLFKKGSPFAASFSHFEIRESQKQLALAIEEAINVKNHLIAEAGTGVGKTFAYLLPCVTKDKKMLISTATKHLQDQLFFKDIPLVEKVTGKKLSICLLKGRNNYICHHRYHEFKSSQHLISFSDKKIISTIASWMSKTYSGDLNELEDFDNHHPNLKKRITSTTDNCLGSECQYFKDCFTQKVREKAKTAQIIVTNHALLMADVVLKETGFAEILPDSEVVVIDEAHQLPAQVAQAFSVQITSNQLVELITDSINACEEIQLDIGETGDDFKQSIQLFLHSLEKFKSTNKISLFELKQLAAYDKFKKMVNTFNDFMQFINGYKKSSDALKKINQRLETVANTIKKIFIPQDKMSGVSLLEWNKNFFMVSRVPISLEHQFSDVMQNYADSWFFLSATLQCDGVFDSFKSQLGLPKEIPSLTVSSPFSYESQSAIHVMEEIVYPNHPDFSQQFLTYSQLIIKAMKGKTFVLFTSHSALNKAKENFDFEDIDTLVQGDAPKAKLIEKFLSLPHAVLLGTMSFWEGVDVVGSKLSCVIIDKIPFPSPGDPIISEKTRYLEANNINAFDKLYLPKAETYLKQGFGRLIRHKTDQGIVVFGDRRLSDKAYGKRLINALPNAKKVDKKSLFRLIEKLFNQVV